MTLEDSRIIQSVVQVLPGSCQEAWENGYETLKLFCPFGL